MEKEEFCKICGNGILYGYATVCDSCEALENLVKPHRDKIAYTDENGTRRYYHAAQSQEG